ncbi:MAG: phosphoglucosamine mutase [Parvularculaceae bacterium]
MRGEEVTTSKREIFGTDGVRGLANSGAMTPANVLALGMAAGRVFRRGEHRHRVVIGKDTRLSGYMIEPALAAGFTAAGMDVFLLGPLPTPAMAMLTRSLRADFGVMISASHNPYEDNGIKFFGPNGFKLSDETEMEIERLMKDGPEAGLVPSPSLGRAQRMEDAGARYIEFAKNTFPKRLSLEGIRIVLDCANGAGYKVSPTVLWELGADVVTIGVEPNGLNINQDCGSTATKAMCEKVREYRADIGIALDGDADRVIICDEKGRVVDGDQIIATIAYAMQKKGKLKGDAVVATIMSNMGLEEYLGKNGLDLVRTKVGDRYVVEAMREQGMNVGGEQSGHIILSDYATTGDGLVTALQVLAVLAEDRTQKVSDLCNRFDPYPQLLKSVRYLEGDPLAEKIVKQAIADGTKTLGKEGRLVMRTSGTEPVVRVMAEGKDIKVVRAVVNDIVAALKKVCG